MLNILSNFYGWAINLFVTIALIIGFIAVLFLFEPAKKIVNQVNLFIKLYNYVPLYIFVTIIPFIVLFFISPMQTVYSPPWDIVTTMRFFGQYLSFLGCMTVGFIAIKQNITFKKENDETQKRLMHISDKSLKIEERKYRLQLNLIRIIVSGNYITLGFNNDHSQYTYSVTYDVLPVITASAHSLEIVRQAHNKPSSTSGDGLTDYLSVNLNDSANLPKCQWTLSVKVMYKNILRENVSAVYTYQFNFEGNAEYDSSNINLIDFSESSSNF